MGLQTVPGFIGQVGYQHPAELLRNFQSGVFGNVSGLCRPGDFLVTPTGTARQISIAAGRAHIQGTENSAQGGYFAWSDSAELRVLAAAGAQPRIDTIVLRVIDSQYGVDPLGAANGALIQVVQGTPGAVPVAVADATFASPGVNYRPGAWLRIADVRVNVIDGVIPGGQVTNYTNYTMPSNGHGFQTLALRNAAIPTPIAGMQSTVTETGESYIYDGTAWVSSKPRWRFTTADLTRTSTTTFLDVTPLGFTIEANSRYKVKYEIFYEAGTAGDIKVGWTNPVGATFVGSRIGLEESSTGITDKAQVDAIGDLFTGTNPRWAGLGAGELLVSYVSGIVTTGANAGTAMLQFTQNTSNATATLLKNRSNCEIWKIA